MFPSRTPPPRPRPARWQTRIHNDNSITIGRDNNGKVTGGSIGPGPAEQSAPGRAADRATVFISYRRGRWHETTVTLIYRELVHRLGTDQVFRDASTLQPGERYPDHLRLHLTSSRVLLAVIHSGWLEDLRRRHTLPSKDWVRFEIEAALETGKVLVPVLLDGAGVLAEHELPDDIRDLANYTACRLRDSDLDRDLATLVDTVAGHLNR